MAVWPNIGHWFESLSVAFDLFYPVCGFNLNTISIDIDKNLKCLWKFSRIFGTFFAGGGWLQLTEYLSMGESQSNIIIINSVSY